MAGAGEEVEEPRRVLGRERLEADEKEEAAAAAATAARLWLELRVSIQGEAARGGGGWRPAGPRQRPAAGSK
jgi:hypothetical protein